MSVDLGTVCQICEVPGGVLQISTDGDDRRIFLGLKLSILGFFWVGKFGNFFLGWLDLSRDFFGLFKTIGRFVVVPTYPGCVVILHSYI